MLPPLLVQVIGFQPGDNSISHMKYKGIAKVGLWDTVNTLHVRVLI